MFRCLFVVSLLVVTVGDGGNGDGGSRGGAIGDSDGDGGGSDGFGDY